MADPPRRAEARQEKVDKAWQIAGDAMSAATKKSKLDTPAPGDDERRLLQRQRLQVATTECTARLQFFESGAPSGTIDGVLASVARRGEAELALAETADERLAILRRLASLAAVIDDLQDVRFKKGGISFTDLMTSHLALIDRRLAVLDWKPEAPSGMPQGAVPPAAAQPAQADPAERKRAREKLIAEAFPAIEKSWSDEERSIGMPVPGDDDRRRLLKERYRALNRALHHSVEYLRSDGRIVSAQDTCAIARQGAAAAAALDGDPARLLAADDRTLLVARLVEAVVAGRVEAGTVPIGELSASEIDRINAELGGLELKAKFPKATPPAPPANSRAIIDLSSPRAQPSEAEMENVRRFFTPPSVNPADTPVRFAFPKAAEPTPTDTERVRLLKERHQFATRELEGRLETLSSSADFRASIGRYRTAALAFAATPKDRLAVEDLVAAIARAGATVSILRESAGRIPMTDFWLNQALRIDSELRVLDARNAAKPAVGPGR
jgi:hypothetical protein